LFEVQPEPEPAGRRKPKRAIPDGFPSAELVGEWQTKARDAGADIDIAYQAERFRNWAAGKDARYADWPATWANWAARAIKEAPKRAGVRAVAATDPLGTWRRRVEAYMTGSRYWNTNDWGGKPGQDGCAAPSTILAEFGFGGAEVLPFPIEGRAA
jgi:hypothetical protein